MVATTAAERDALREGGKLLGSILAEVAAAVRPGIPIRELDHLAERRIRAVAGAPAFKNYCPPHAPCGFPGALCISVNREVVHGVPTRPIILAAGDIVGLDIGMRFPTDGGYFTDTAVTVPVCRVSRDVQRLITVTKRALDAGIAAAQMGNRLRDIGVAVQRVVEDAGFDVVRALVGHGVGEAVHEGPQVPNFWDRYQVDQELTDGLVIAIEPMVAMRSGVVETLDDGWTVVTADGSLSAHFEHTVLITSEGTEVLTNP